MGILFREEFKLQKAREDLLRPHIRPRAQRFSDPTCSKFTQRECAAALWAAGGNVSEAHRLLVKVSGVDANPGYLRRRIKDDPKLAELVRYLNLENRVRQRGGKPVCQVCGSLIDIPKEAKP